MSDTTTGTTETTSGEGSATETTTTEDQLGDAGKKALQAERAKARAAEKARDEALAKVQTFELAGKTEAERLQAQLTALQTERDTARTEGLRYRIAAQHGIDADDAETFLTASTEEAMTKQAERLVELRGSKPGAPKADPSQGNRGGDQALNGDPLLASLKAKIGIPG